MTSNSQFPRQLRGALAMLAALLAVVAAAPVVGAVAASDAPPVAQTYSLDAFVHRFKDAFARRDESLAEALFFWEGLNARDRDLIFKLIEHDLDKHLIGLRVYTADRDQHDNRVMNMNLTVVAQLVARFVDDSGRVHHSLHQLGVKDGEFFIALARSIRPGAIVI